MSTISTFKRCGLGDLLDDLYDFKPAPDAAAVKAQADADAAARKDYLGFTQSLVSSFSNVAASVLPSVLKPGEKVVQTAAGPRVVTQTTTSSMPSWLLPVGLGALGLGALWFLKGRK